MAESAMLQQARDFVEESDALAALVERIPASAWLSETQFKRWTFADIVAHLHIGNHLALLSLTEPPAYWALVSRLMAAHQGEGHLAMTHAWLGHASGPEIFSLWREFYPEVAQRFGETDPATRVPWAGAEMSARSSITARIMETWAHGHAIFDALGQTRVESDRIRAIAHLGVKTFAWAFRIRNLPVPAAAPLVRLEAPSGAVWEWNAASTDGRVEGSAVEFCQVVTQVRNVADTTLRVEGEKARQWMSIAQCFAGPPEAPPAPGARYRISRAN